MIVRTLVIHPGSRALFPRGRDAFFAGLEVSRLERTRRRS
jgi:hypothetical protein